MKRRLKSSLDAKDLALYVCRQLNSIFPDGMVYSEGDLLHLVESALDRVEYCFSHIENRYFFDGEASIFNHLHGDQYAMFLYFLSRVVFLEKLDTTNSLASKLFLLNKSLHGLDAFYEIELPSVFLFVHPIGTVLGRATYKDFLVVYQRCGVGSNHGIYPQIDGSVTLHPGSSVLGKCHVGEGSSLGTGALLIDKDLICNTIYLGNPKNYTILPGRGPNPIWRSHTRELKMLQSDKSDDGSRIILD